LDADARNEAGARQEAVAWVATRTSNGRDDAGSVAGNWPYLAI
jgi:hypothetical protein